MTSEPDEVDERRLHPAWIATRAFAVLRGLVPAFIALAVGLREWAVPAALVIALVVIGLRVLEWRVTRYAVVDGTLRVRSGILARRERVVPASRISALDTSRGLVQRAFGLVALEVQTAGGGKAAELRLDALTSEEAERLRAALGHAAAAEAGPRVASAPGAPAAGSVAADASSSAAGPVDAGGAVVAAGPVGAGRASADEGPGAADEQAGSGRSGSASPAGSVGSGVVGGQTVEGAPGRPAIPWPGARPEPAPVYAITGRQLVIAALTGPQIGLVAVLVGSVLAQGQELLPESVRDRVGDEVSGANATMITVVVLVGVLIAAAVSVAGTVLAFAEFAVVRDDRRLRVRRGLITERTGTIPLDRIHGVRIVEGLLRRPLGYATVQVEVAGYRGDNELTRTLVPLVHRSDLPELLHRMLPEVPWTDAELSRPPARARRRYWTVPLLVALVPALITLVVVPEAWQVVAVLPLVLGLVLGESRWRGAGWALGPETLTVRNQLVARTTLLALARRVQRVQRRSQPFQRRVDLATFGVALATGRRGTVRHLEAADADDLQRSVAARTSRAASPAVPRDGSLSFAAPPE